MHGTPSSTLLQASLIPPAKFHPKGVVMNGKEVKFCSLCHRNGEPETLVR
jgi:hypothetical protein